jgi:hypothetical protein
MMWLVRLALNCPYTFVVAAILIVVLTVVAIVRTPTAIFPDINIPVVSVVWGYTGLAPEEMERRLVTLYERAVTTTVNDIEHIESQSYYGIGVVKIFFRQGADIQSADINGAVAQATALAQAMLRFRLADTSTLRVYADVPEVDSKDVAIGVSVDLETRGTKGKKFGGKVVRTAVAKFSVAPLLPCSPWGRALLRIRPSTTGAVFDRSCSRRISGQLR